MERNSHIIAVENILWKLYVEKGEFKRVDHPVLVKKINSHILKKYDKQDFVNQCTTPTGEYIEKTRSDKNNAYMLFLGDARDLFYREILKIPKRTKPYFTVDPGYVQEHEEPPEMHVTESGQIF